MDGEGKQLRRSKENRERERSVMAGTGLYVSTRQCHSHRSKEITEHEMINKCQAEKNLLELKMLYSFTPSVN
jgi:hypothetical protein